MSFDVYGVSTVFARSAHRPNERSTRIELACKCHDCHTSTLFVLEATTLVGGQPPKTAFGQNESPVAFGYEEIYSFPLSAVEPTPPDTPEPAATFYHQAVAALAYGLYDAAGSMFRKCLESVTRSDSLVAHIPPDQHEQFRKSRLKARITKLKEVHAIPPALADLVDVIKEEGNGAVHDDVLYDKESAISLRNFTRTFLEQTFTIPKQISRVKGKRPN